MLTKELETTVWAALQSLPETYREPLVLFYREHQSIKEVALGLGLSEDTAKQRLSRGRQQLKDHVSELVEQSLHKTRPRKAAAAAVLAALLAYKTKPAEAAVARSIPRTKHWKWAAAAVAVCAVTAAIVVVGTARHDAPRASSPDSRELIVQLRRAHDAYRASAPPSQTCELAGSVTRADHSAVRDTLVAIIDGSKAGSLEPRFVEVDGSGSWKLALVPGAYLVMVSAPGHRAGSRVVTCVPDHRGDVSFMLSPDGATLRGSVSDTGGGPVAGATIWLFDPNQPDQPYVTRSGADGKYELTVEPSLYSELVVHADYTLDTRPLTLRPGGVREDVTLLPGGSIEGTVVDGSGAPIAGATVNTVAPTRETLARAPARWQMAAFYGAVLPAVSDASGRFVLRGLAPGNVQLVARAPAFATTTPTALDLTLAENRTGVTVSAVPARSISGFVVARGGSRGLAGVRVIAMREGALIAMPMVVATDATGYFEITGLAAARYRIAAVAPGFVPYVSDDAMAIADRDARDTLLALDRGVTVRGTLAPGMRGTVKLVPSTITLVQVLRAGLTRADVDEHGNFEFSAVAPGSYSIVASTFDQRGERKLEVGGNAPAPVQVAMAPRPAISGEVVDDRGTKLAGALVQAVPDKIRDFAAVQFSTVRTDERGAFRIIAVEPGEYELIVFDAKGQRAWAGERKRPFKPHSVTVPATGGAEQTLTVTSGGASITGVVVGADQHPVADAWIEVHARDARRPPAVFPAPPILSDATGRFAIDGLYGTDFVVEASGPTGKLRAVTVTQPGARVKLDLRPLSTVSGEVTRDGKPVAAFDVVMRDRRLDVSERAAGTGGRFSLPAQPGEYELVVTSPDGYAKQGIKVDADTKLDLALVEWGSLRGRVVGDDGKPWVDAKLWLRHALDPSPVRTDADGNFTIEHVSAGKNELSIIGAIDRMELTEFHFELAPGQQLDVGVIEAGALHTTNASSSADLGLQFFVSVDAPTRAQLAAVAKDPAAAWRAGSDPKAGLWIAGVTANSPAARAGLRTGDRIIGVGMTKVDLGKSSVDMLKSLSTPWRSSGRPVRFTIVRAGRELTFDVLVP